MLTVHLLGRVEVRRDGSPVDLGGPQQRAVIAHLALEVDRVVSVERLIDRIWGDDPPRTPVGTLQSYVSRLPPSDRAGAAPVHPPGCSCRRRRATASPCGPTRSTSRCSSRSSTMHVTWRAIRRRWSNGTTGRWHSGPVTRSPASGPPNRAFGTGDAAQALLGEVRHPAAEQGSVLLLARLDRLDGTPVQRDR